MAGIVWPATRLSRAGPKLGNRVFAARQPPDHRARPPSWHRAAHRPAARLPHPSDTGGRGPRARRRHPRGQGEGGPVRDLLQPRGRSPLSHMRGRTPFARADLRRRGAERRDPDRAHARVARPLPRPRRRALPDRRHRPGGSAHHRAASAARERRRARGRSRHQRDHNRRGHRALPRGRNPGARAGCDGHAARQRAAGRRRPRVRRRDHAREGAPGSARAVIPRAAGLAASAGFAVSVFVGPWFALFRYTPNGWHATLWARVALLFAVANVVLTALALVPAIRVALAALATAAVAIRLIWPPDFGLALNGLSVR